MKKSLLVILGAFLVCFTGLFISCDPFAEEDDDPYAVDPNDPYVPYDPNDPNNPNNPNNPNQGNKSTWIVWIKEDLGVGTIDVYLSGQFKGKIDTYYPDGVLCNGTAYDVMVTPEISAQTQYLGVTAKSTDGTEWAWNLAFVPGACSTMELTHSNAVIVNNQCKPLDGTWVRQSEGTSPGTTGMIVTFANGQGIITSVGTNSPGYAPGQVIWKNLDFANCKLDDLHMPSNTYSTGYIDFTGGNQFSINNIVTYKRQ